jgi:hypothetical protein
MKFKIAVRHEQLAKEETVKVEFYLKKNLNGSIGLYVFNNSIDLTDVQLLSIGTDGIIRRDNFSLATSDNAFMKYDTVGGYQRVRVF